MCVIYVFFFKQKTAYEMRISDWSSDVCSSDLAKTPELLAAFGRAVESLGGAYVTAEDVGITDADMVEIAKHTKHVSGLPVTSGADAGGDPGPFTALGVYLGIKAAIREGLKTDRDRKSDV